MRPRPPRSFVLLLLCSLAGSVRAQQDPLLPPPNGPRTTPSERIVLVGALVRVDAATPEAERVVVLEGGFVREVVAPEDWSASRAAGARVVDLKGLRLYPGFVDPYVEVDAPTPKADRPGAHWNPRVAPDRDVLHGSGLDAKTAADLRKLGFCAAGLAPRGGLFRGFGAVAPTSAPPTDAAAARARVLYPLAFQLVGLRSGGGGFGGGRPAADAPPEGPWSGYPNSLMGAIALVRQTYYDADFPAAGVSCLAPLRQDPPTWFDVDDELDLLRAAKIVAEHELAERNAVVFVGGGFEFRRLGAVAEALLAPSAFLKGLVVPLNFPDAPAVGTVAEQEAVELRDLMNWEQAPTNPRRLARAGVPFALTSARLRDRGVFHERLRSAIKHGLTEAEALAALTSTPATLLGLGGSLGVIAAGRVANLVVTDGPLFAEKTKIRDVYVSGVRHEVEPAPPRDLAGVWTVTFEGAAPPRARSFAIDADRNVKVRVDDRESDAKNVKFEHERLTFTVDHAPLGASGTYGVSAVVEGDEMTGVGARADGTRFRFTARRDPNASRPTSRPESAPASRPDEGAASGPASAPASRPVDESPPQALALPFGPYGFDAPASRPAVVHVVGGTVWTCGPEGVIEDGYVVVENGVVKEVGRGRPAGEADVVVDARGRHVTPGVIDCHSHTGVSGSVNEGGQAVTAEVRIQDVLDPDDVNWYRQLAAGVTCVNVLHGSANAIGGQNAVVKLRWGAEHPDGMRLRGAPGGIKFALGENPRQANSGGEGFGRAARDPRYPQTRMGVEALIRDRFHAARAYAVARERDPEGVRVDLELEALAEVLSGGRFVHCHSYRQDELLMLAKVAEEFGFRIGTYQHVLEGYKVADAIARSARGASSFADWWAYKIEVWDGIPHNGSLMREQGVVVSFNSDSDEMARRMNVEAAKAVRHGGTPEAEALKFVTLNPAYQLGVEGLVGSLEPGKHADFAVWSGPPLSTYARCEETWVDGVRRFSLADDAAHRGRIDGERARLIQKALTGGDKGGAGGGGGGRRGRGRPSDAADADAVVASAQDVDAPESAEARASRIARMRALFQRGDYRGMRPGDCGCAATESAR
jgi:imidazolonepropionase-like amidohydrolase